MTQEEILELEYNKRCAEFLGMYDYSKDNEFFEKGKYFCYPEKDKNPGSGYYTVLQKIGNEYKGIFNSDWNCIMEVVEAIKNTTNPKEHSNTTFSTLRYEIQSHLGRSNKEAVVQAINQFLIWYNENKKL